MHGSRGCFGCCVKPSASFTVDRSSNVLRNQGESGKQHSSPENFRSTSSAGEMDYNGLQSQRSISSIGTINQPLDPNNIAGSTSNPSEFVNHDYELRCSPLSVHPFRISADAYANRRLIAEALLDAGLLLWEETRQQWLANKKSPKNTQVREPTISWNATYESLLGTNKPFPQRIPLPEMVDFLLDIWEQEGLYD